MDHCVSAFIKSKRELAYRIYMSDALEAMVNCYGRTHGAQGDIIEKRFIDVLEPPKPKKEESAEDVINRIKRKLRGK